MSKYHCRNILLWLVLANVIVYGLYTIVTMPLVEFSHSTGQCVAVHSPSGEYSCSNLPARYEHVFVK